MVITDRLVSPDPERRRLVTTVARQVMLAHWPRTAHGCRPCGSVECGRMVLAATWLEVVGEPTVPDSVLILRPSATPSVQQLRRLTGMG
ncbi:hypothetical protein C6W10_04965 [Plantactinospora sp. BB1]|nr:hypothetical protein C6W10_04965 [Plantactinospora sp. BB1]